MGWLNTVKILLGLNTVVKRKVLTDFLNLHVSPPSTDLIEDSLTWFRKVCNVVDVLVQTILGISKNKVSVDESTIVFKFYNKENPIKWGFKVFVLSESSSGYICALGRYFGKCTTDKMAEQLSNFTSS